MDQSMSTVDAGGVAKNEKKVLNDLIAHQEGYDVTIDTELSGTSMIYAIQSRETNTATTLICSWKKPENQ